MHIGKAITFLCLTIGASSYKIRAFKGRDCKGASKVTNVWDNRCATPNYPTKSFRVLEYGRWRQRAYFYPMNHCLIGKVNDWWADGGSDTFLKGRCINLAGTARAYASWST
ncbi:hypothetical protein CEP52_011855 [Fusarium oligoseptatum]|uniref:Uncharacterized protein n=2 Tax=Fusarium solani species complex TaxID=232080 RepID=A0A428T173_9HYPO|nr:hypothetical protein CEP52_011855 [Fusarium oligoseptatum]RSM09092.1 hypothetical protein CDV31_007859 [Fusarium ambrosium]